MPEQMGDYPHLNLVFRSKNPARLPGGGSASVRAQENKAQRIIHSTRLGGQLSSWQANARENRQQREADGLPPIQSGVPFVVELADGSDLDDVVRKLKLEVVSEEYLGDDEEQTRYVLVATEDIDSPELLQIIQNFSTNIRGSAIVADLFEIISDPEDPRRIQAILSETLFASWPFPPDTVRTLDLSFQISGVLADLGDKPRKGRRESVDDHAQRVNVWFQSEKNRVYESWDTFLDNLQDEVANIIEAHGGEVCSIVQDNNVAIEKSIVKYPDSITMRVIMPGKGFSDLIRNHPRIFEVVEPDDIETSRFTATHDEADWPDFELTPPAETAPIVGIIDSGIQEGHRYLNSAILQDRSLCILPDRDSDDVADEVRYGGHGTRVAGAVIFPNDEIPQGTYQGKCWLINFRVLDQNNRMPKSIFPPAMLEKAISHMHDAQVFVHSINANSPCRIRHMSAWAAKIDDLSHRENLLFVVSAGNLYDRASVPSRGILDYLDSGKPYPEYLLEASARIAQPAQSLQALSVGSIAHFDFNDGYLKAIAGPEHPSPFSRTGLGIWDTIKPDVVEFGGDECVPSTGPAASLVVNEETAPLLIRSTINGGPSLSRDGVGTSFAAPKVASLAAEILQSMPGTSALLTRALIVNSARWPQWAEQEQDIEHRGQFFRNLGYGKPTWERALGNDPQRVTIVTPEIFELKAGEASIFEIPIPPELNAPGQESRFRIDITLSYSSEPRRTRASIKGYQSVWLDWRTSSFGQPLQDFLGRMWTTEERDPDTNARSIPWMLNCQNHHGQARGLRRNGTLQKDWAYCEGYDLPETFAIAVRGHKGWNKSDPEATAKYTLAITIESLDPEIEVYASIQAEIEARVQVGATRITV